jgi:hypothetical protein
MPLVKWGITTFFSIWHHRNDSAHNKTDSNADPVAVTRLKARVCDYYSRKDTLPTSEYQIHQDAIFL